MGKIYQVVVHGLRGEKLMIDLCNTEEQMQKMTVRQLKEKIAEKLPQTAGQENLRLIFTDKHLEGDNTLLSEYGIQHMSVIQLVIKVPGGQMAIVSLLEGGGNNCMATLVLSVCLRAAVATVYLTTISL
ncbi:hypothetical protein CCH79_00012896 [Gambusia affinis]|uniref:Ubiquitin-like domain-containing protein n=1 Tax=Gambusia affinis TaxID=33528 RepID=A0A315W0Y8_GAMAF|nr:hypothetical protein CCH79_00012896 [Gambusia affinis]